MTNQTKSPFEEWWDEAGFVASMHRPESIARGTWKASQDRILELLDEEEIETVTLHAYWRNTDWADASEAIINHIKRKIEG